MSKALIGAPTFTGPLPPLARSLLMNESYDVDRSAQTVVNLAEQMSRLRSEAIRLKDGFETGQRGYFTPSEDEQVLHLWVTYQRSRAALLELIDSTRRAVGKASDESLIEFAIAYAAGLALVDAARTLRDLFAKDPLVRAKLNESVRPYRIAAGSFDAIQMSLTDPENAWRLQQAHSFFDSRESSIRKILTEQPLCGVLDVIEQLGPNCRVGATRYVKARVVERSRGMRVMIQGSVSQVIYLIQEMGSRFVSNLSTDRSHVPQLPEPIASELLALLRPGDVLVTRKENAVTNYFLPGYWPHAAFYIGQGTVIEALKDGVRERTMESPFGNDAVAVIRPAVGLQCIEQAIERARTHVGKPYDFDFDFTRGDRLVCTEVVYRSFEGLEGLKLPLSIRLGRQTLSAEDLLELAIRGNGFEQIAVFCPRFSDRLVVPPEMTMVLQQTVAQD